MKIFKIAHVLFLATLFVVTINAEEDETVNVDDKGIYTDDSVKEQQSDNANENDAANEGENEDDDVDDDIIFTGTGSDEEIKYLIKYCERSMGDLEEINGVKRIDLPQKNYTELIEAAVNLAKDYKETVAVGDEAKSLVQEHINYWEEWLEILKFIVTKIQSDNLLNSPTAKFF